MPANEKPSRTAAAVALEEKKLEEQRNKKKKLIEAANTEMKMKKAEIDSIRAIPDNEITLDSKDEKNNKKDETNEEESDSDDN
uniref:Uncharacterized protein n=1 Tax=Ditylenchus dipsaci TaxID=166011 RepID=A0A915CT15_9BILA